MKTEISKKGETEVGASKVQPIEIVLITAFLYYVHFFLALHKNKFFPS